MTSKLDTNYTLTVLTNFLKIEYAANHRNEYFFVSAIHMEVRDDNLYTLGDNLHDVVTLDFNNCTNIIESTIEDFIESVTEILIFATTVGTPTADINLITIKGVSVATGKGTITAGTQRFTLATDDCLNVAITALGITTSANNVLLASIDTEIDNIGTTTSVSNTLLGSIESGISGLGVTSSSGVVLLSSIDDILIDIGITTSSIDALLTNIETDTGNIDLELTALGTTTSANNLQLVTIANNTTSGVTDTADPNTVILTMGLESRIRSQRLSEIERPFSIYMESELVTTTERSLGMPSGSGQNIFLFKLTETALQFSSSSNLDNGTTGTGALTITVSGLTRIGGIWADITEVITLTGTDPVSTSSTDWWRINKIFVVTTGSNDTNVGDIYVSDVGQSTTIGVPDADIRSAVINGFGSSTCGIFSVKTGFRFNYTRGNTYTTASSTKPAVIHETGWFDFNDSGGKLSHYNVGFLGTAGPISYNFDGAAPYFQESDLDLRAFTETGTNNSLVLYYEVMLSPNSAFLN